MCENTIGQKTIEAALFKLSKEKPDQAARAKAALEILLDWTRSSPWKDVIWDFSRLTGDGFPLEFECSSSGNSVSYTVEPAGPEADERKKHFLAEKKLLRLGMPPVPAFMHGLFSELQKSGTLSYGCWVGGRHDVREDRYKLYVEVPDGYSGDFPVSFLGKASLLQAGVPRLEMVGYEPLSSEVELYFSVREERGLFPRELSYLLGQAGFSAQAEAFFGLIEAAHRDTLAGALAHSSIGFSFTCMKNGDITGFSLFKFARSVCGGDGRTRKRVLSLGRKYGWDTGGYAALSEALRTRNVWNTQHGMMGFGLKAGAGPFLQIGLRPPEPPVFELEG
ncbi:TPA: hypothetical protein HA351_01250 [Methanosarcinaceae archaeon]|nr:hypothetical protein [Methanosarcinaceae archaeon]